jgi:hypothetical protein
MRILPAMLLSIAVLLGVAPCLAGRVTVSLDGSWAIADGQQAEQIPARFDHTVVVPGLVNQAQPRFADVDHYETHEYVYTMARYGVLPPTDKVEGVARTRQKRKFFWYERTFTVAERKQVAMLVVHKAQFGTAVWLNGRKIGEHLGCFTAGYFDLSRAMQWNAPNRLLVRIGAHPGALAESVPAGSDGEKAGWTPGIYDRVELLLSDNPVIENVQVAPRIQAGEVVVQTQLVNYGPACTTEVRQQVETFKGGQAVGGPVVERVELRPGERRQVRQTVRVPKATLWCPENPFLYVLKTGTAGDSCVTRFGMREFRFDTSTRRAMLNGKVCFLRGSSITLHRFFGDPKCGSLPWNEAWLHKFLVEIPRQMHWNAFRLCIGPVPQRWLDVADEAGLLLQYEFPIWSDREPLPHKRWSEAEVTAEVGEFVRDNWNHPSVVLWDASNETHWAFLREKLIPAVRGLDLSNRNWENGYNLPQGPDDPYEDHPYLFIDHTFAPKPPYFQMVDLERMTGRKGGGMQSAHASVINEYGWLWLHRDGRPTVLTRKPYEHLMSPKATADERRAFYAYCLGGMTEFWRAYRQYAGVLYLAYLDGDLPSAFTCDNFVDVERLELDPYFANYMREAFKPVGVYVNFWQPHLAAGSSRSYRVMLVNDSQQAVAGRLELGWQAAGSAVGPDAAQPFAIPALGQMTYDVTLASPPAPGRCVLTAKAICDGQAWSPTLCRRNVSVYGKK